MALLETLQEKFGSDFHPAKLLAQVISDENEDIKLRVDCAKSLMPYVESQRKAVEVRANINSDTGLLRVSLFDEQKHFSDEDVEELKSISDDPTMEINGDDEIFLPINQSIIDED